MLFMHFKQFRLVFLENLLVCIGGVIHLKKLDRRLGRKFSRHSVLEIVTRTKLLTTGKKCFLFVFIGLKEPNSTKRTLALGAC